MPTITFKVTDDEARRIQASARQRRLTVSEYLRRQTRAPEVRGSRVRRVRCEHTGALIFAPPPGLVPLTTADVREILSEFP